MRPARNFALFCALLATAGCHRKYTPPETPMPPDTILLSQMMRQLTATHPDLIEHLIDQIDSGGKKGPALLTPDLVAEFRKRILGKDWSGLDRFPGWDMREINSTVHAVADIAGKNPKLEKLSAVHPGAPTGAPGPDSRTRVSASQDAQADRYLDLGPYAPDQSQTISFDSPAQAEPSNFPSFTTGGIVTDLGDGVVRGDGPNALAPEHAESQRLADALNRLAVNDLENAAPFTVTLHKSTVTTPQKLIENLLQSGQTVTVTDTRYFANFGHFHYTAPGSMGPAQDVMMPFWVNSEIVVPHSGGRPLLVPVSHAEYEWHIHSAAGARGPLINADVAYYFGVDGKAEWRTMDTLDQAWVLKRNAHTYTGAQAVEVTRLAGLFTLAYMHQHQRRPNLPFGGYYALGVCQDAVSAIEKKMTGAVTLFPNTADDALFNDSRDAEVNALLAAIPKDRNGSKPDPARIFGSLPTAPDAAGHFTAITIPGLAADLNATYAAWKNNKLERTHTTTELTKAWLFVLSAALLGFFGAVLTLRFRNKHPIQRRSPR